MSDKTEAKETVHIGDNAQIREVYTGGKHIHHHQPLTPSVAEAQARLEEMPTDELPAVKSLPVSSRIPFGRYAHFVGREIELRQLASILKAEHGRIWGRTSWIEQG